jgi:predicted transcriptional regulator of viral defense system
MSHFSIEDNLKMLVRMTTNLTKRLEVIENNLNKPAKVFTTDEVAQKFQVHPQTVRTWVKDGKLSYIPNTRYRFSIHHLNEFTSRSNKYENLI